MGLKNEMMIQDVNAVATFVSVTSHLKDWRSPYFQVEQSLQSGLREGMMLEVPNRTNPSTYWMASIVMACGPLLRLRFVGQEGDKTQDFWCDLTKVQVYPLGWCREHHLHLQPPRELQPKLLDYEAFAIRALQNAESVPPELLSGVSNFI